MSDDRLNEDSTAVEGAAHHTVAGRVRRCLEAIEAEMAHEGGGDALQEAFEVIELLVGADARRFDDQAPHTPLPWSIKFSTGEGNAIIMGPRGQEVARFWADGDQSAATANAEFMLSAIRSALEPFPAQPVAEQAMIEDIIDGTAPGSKWMGSVDYSTYDDFEVYLKSQLRQKLDLKVRLDKKRHESAEDESLATFVDGGSGALQEALETYRNVRARVAAPKIAPAAEGLIERIDAAIARERLNLMPLKSSTVTITTLELCRRVLSASPAPVEAEVREDDQYEPAAVRLLRGPLSKRATSAEFNEWQAREVIEYIDGLRALSPQKESGN